MLDDDRHVVIIGSGPTGVIAALTLVQARIPVIMLEAGSQQLKGLHIKVSGKDILTPEPLPLDKHCSYTQFINTGDCRARWIQGRFVGGLSNFWGGVVLRFAPNDFDQGKHIHEKFKWPITYGDLLPYYERVEKLIHVSGSKSSFDVLPACNVAKEVDVPGDWQDLVAAANDLDHSIISLPKTSGPNWLVDNVASQFAIGTRLLKPLMEQSQLFRLITGAKVLKLGWNSHKHSVNEVIYYDEGSGQEKRIFTQAVVLAAGSLSSTQILLNSSCSDFPEGLGNINRLLGRYLHDNPLECVSVAIDAKLKLLKRGLYMTRASYSSSPPLRTVGYQIYGGTSRLANARKAIRAVSNQQNSPECLLNFFCFGTTIPSFDNYLKLSDIYKDSNNMPLPELSIKFTSEDQKNMELGKRKIVEILNSTKYNFSVLDSSVEPPGVSVHYGGTVRMHESPEHGLLDAWNRMYAVPNLFVVDASCFTTSVEKNPTLTAMALSMRAMDKLVSNLRSGSNYNG